MSISDLLARNTKKCVLKESFFQDRPKFEIGSLGNLSVLKKNSGYVQKDCVTASSWSDSLLNVSSSYFQKC
jgi:hypothetical protein